MRQELAALAAAAMLSMSMVAGPSEALAQRQTADGLVVVQIGNVSDVVDIAVAADLIVQACGVQAGVNVLDILSRIDQRGGQFTFCRADGGNVTARNN